MRKAISIALLMLGAGGVIAQRRGAFVAGPPYAGRPVVPAATGTPGAALWNPGPGGGGPSPGPSLNRGGTPQIVAMPVPVIAGDSEPDPQPIESVPPEPMPPPPPAVVAAPPIPEVPQHRSIRLPPDPPEPPHVLIALNNGWVYAATAYWVEGRTLHYVTGKGDHNQVSLELVDRKLSTRLNRALHIEFVLP